MYFATVAATILALAPATILAAPAPAVMPTISNVWTLTGFKRVCDAGDNKCSWSFGVATYGTTPDSGVAGCKYDTFRADSDTGASQVSAGPVTCGAYTITSNWSDQFGAENGFTAMALKGYGKIVFPAYTDASLNGGKVVSPDLSFEIHNL
jgi:hypothetical protein